MLASPCIPQISGLLSKHHHGTIHPLPACCFLQALVKQALVRRSRGKVGGQTFVSRQQSWHAPCFSKSWRRSCCLFSSRPAAPIRNWRGAVRQLAGTNNTFQFTFNSGGDCSICSISSKKSGSATKNKGVKNLKCCDEIDRASRNASFG